MNHKLALAELVVVILAELKYTINSAQPSDPPGSVCDMFSKTKQT